MEHSGKEDEDDVLTGQRCRSGSITEGSFALEAPEQLMLMAGGLFQSLPCAKTLRSAFRRHLRPIKNMRGCKDASYIFPPAGYFNKERLR